jgi:hypothetical protein
LRTSGGIPLISAAAADPMVLLGDVREGQEVREGTRNRDGVPDGKTLQHAGQRIELALTPGAPALRQRPDPLDGLEERVTAALS